MRRGEPTDIEDLVHQYPVLAAELRTLWATIWVAELMASDEEATESSADRERPSASSTIAPDLEPTRTETRVLEPRSGDTL